MMNLSIHTHPIMLHHVGYTQVDFPIIIVVHLFPSIDNEDKKIHRHLCLSNFI